MNRERQPGRPPRGRAQRGGAQGLGNLARYKFSNFGYWSSIWVRLNRLGGFNRPNPFRPVVKVARRCRDGNRQELEK